jgi:hypothetical protein
MESKYQKTRKMGLRFDFTIRPVRRDFPQNKTGGSTLNFILGYRKGRPKWLRNALRLIIISSFFQINYYSDVQSTDFGKYNFASNIQQYYVVRSDCWVANNLCLQVSDMEHVFFDFSWFRTMICHPKTG